MDHIEELGNIPSEQPLLFMKPETALVDIQQNVKIPLQYGQCHNEVELAFLVGETLTNADQQTCGQAVVGVALALDLTLRDLQTQLKKDGHPWERAKAFDGSCPISGFVPLNGYDDEPLTFSLKINHKQVQLGDSRLMLHKVLPLLSHISKIFTLMPGDVVLTGTPKGVGPLYDGDIIDIELCEHFSLQTCVEAIA
jgi:2-keto-4-pentenoate hydratase/2-oxohepta-3-ene-1,7-dioic acid hydratase in catechol pathway